MAPTRNNGGSTALAEKLQQQAGAPATQPASPANTIAAYLKKMESQIAQALPKHMSIERLTRIALTTIRTNPKLLECTVPSLMAAIFQSAQLGLEPGLLGHCYLIPFRNNKTNTMEVQFIIGYKGMIDLARRSGNIQSIAAHVVYENDQIELEYGLDDKLKHIPWFLRKDDKFEKGGSVVGAYMVAKFRDGGHQIHYMPISDILKHRDRSSGYQNAVKYKRTDNPWFTDEEEMYKKTTVRAGIKWLPISVEDIRLMSQDETVRQDISEINDDIVIDISGSSSREEEGPSGQPERDIDEVEFDK